MSVHFWTHFCFSSNSSSSKNNNNNNNTSDSLKQRTYSPLSRHSKCSKASRVYHRQQTKLQTHTTRHAKWVSSPTNSHSLSHSLTQSECLTCFTCLHLCLCLRHGCEPATKLIIKSRFWLRYKQQQQQQKQQRRRRRKSHCCCCCCCNMLAVAPKTWMLVHTEDHHHETSKRANLATTGCCWIH